jgi:hypothetical protein
MCWGQDIFLRPSLLLFLGQTLGDAMKEQAVTADASSSSPTQNPTTLLKACIGAVRVLEVCHLLLETKILCCCCFRALQCSVRAITEMSANVVQRKKGLREEIIEGLGESGDVERRLRSTSKDLYVVLVIMRCYMLTSGNDSTASAVYSFLSACFSHGFDPVDAFSS